MAPTELTNDVTYQIGAVQALAQAAGTAVKYVKPHGALYNTIVLPEVQAQTVVEAIGMVDQQLPMMVLPHSEIQRAAQAAGLRTVTEAFGDRTYNPDGTLVSRRQPGSVLHSIDAVVEHALRLVAEGKARAIDGKLIEVDAQSVCVHADTPGPVAMAPAVREALQGARVRVGSFA